MKINGTDLQSAMNVYRNAQVQGKPQETGAPDKAAAPAPQQDRLALSDKGRIVADAQRAIGSVPDVRTSLVSQIRNDLQNGTYVVDSQKAAEGLLKESLVNQAALA